MYNRNNKYAKKDSQESFESPIQKSDGQTPWNQQPGESSKSYSAFLIYLQMGVSRTLKKVAETIYDESTSGKVRQIQHWSSDHDWVSRCEAFDRFQLGNRSKKITDRVKEAEDIMLKWLPEVTQTLVWAALGYKINNNGQKEDFNVSRTQMSALKTAIDQFAGQRGFIQTPDMGEQKQISAPDLPSKVSDQQEIQEADYEDITDEASELVPDKLKNKRKNL